jgi:hypothetical protein
LRTGPLDKYPLDPCDTQVQSLRRAGWKETVSRGELPPDPFPQTPLELIGMEGPALTSLLDFYSVPVPHTIEDRRHSAFRIPGLTKDGLKFD